MRHAIKLPLSLTVILLLATSATALADKLEVNMPGSFDKYSADLVPGQLAMVTVYLKSDGDLIDGYEVRLVDEVTHSTVESGKSDPNGEVVFRSTRAGRYVLVLDVPEKLRRLTTVALADVRITPEGGRESQ